MKMRLRSALLMSLAALALESGCNGANDITGPPNDPVTAPPVTPPTPVVTTHPRPTPTYPPCHDLRALHRKNKPCSND